MFITFRDMNILYIYYISYISNIHIYYNTISLIVWRELSECPLGVLRTTLLRNCRCGWGKHPSLAAYKRCGCPKSPWRRISWCVWTTACSLPWARAGRRCSGWPRDRKELTAGLGPDSHRSQPVCLCFPVWFQCFCML